MAGLILGLGGKENGFLDRFRLFANGLALRFPSNREFGGQMGNVGAHLQLKLIGGIDAKVTEWGGIDLTSGIEHTTYTFALRQGLPIEAPITGGSARWTADGTYDVSTTSTSVPLEVSTNLRVAVVTAYLGGAYDLNNAVSTSSVSLSGPITGTVDMGTAGQVTDEQLGSASAGLSAYAPAQPQVARIFAGVQANVLALKGFAHLNLTLNGGVGGHVGVRVAI